MKSAAYLYRLMGNEDVTRRDLPQASPVTSLAVANDELEASALLTRSVASARNYGFLSPLKPSQPGKPKLVPSADGAIAAMLFTVPLRNTKGTFSEIYKKLLETLPQSTRFFWLVNSDSVSAVEGWLETYGRTATSELIEAPNHVAFSIWAQDAYAVAEAENGDTYFIEPLSFLRYADAVIADYICNGSSYKNFQAPLYFQGGNILIGDDFWFIGIDYPTRTLQYVQDVIMPRAGETAEMLVLRLFSEYLDSSRNLHYIGATVPVPAEAVVLAKENGTYFVDIVFQGNHHGTAQPLFHVDMFLTLAGRGTNGKYRVFVGDPSLAPAPQSTGFTAYSMQRVYDSVADNLRALGFEVIRNPLPITFSQRMVSVSDLNRPDDSELYAVFLELSKIGVVEVVMRSWYFATSNNALVQSTATSKQVWLPTYGHGSYGYLAVSDAENKRLWESLGYTVTLLPSFHQLAQALGAVHCIQKYLGRSQGLATAATWSPAGT